MDFRGVGTGAHPLQPEFALDHAAGSEKCIHEHTLSIKAHLKVESNLQALLGLSQFYPQVETTKLFPADARPFSSARVACPKSKCEGWR